MILFCCLVTLHRIREMAVVNFLFDTVNNRLDVQRKQLYIQLLSHEFLENISVTELFLIASYSHRPPVTLIMNLKFVLPYY